MEELLKKILLEEYSGPMGWTRDAKEKNALELLESVKKVADYDEKAWGRLYGVLVRLTNEVVEKERRLLRPTEEDKRNFKEQLVGAPVLGVDFSDAPEAHNGPGWCGQMASFVGQPGTVEHYDRAEDTYKIRFEDGDFWNYPARLILLQFC